MDAKQPQVVDSTQRYIETDGFLLDRYRRTVLRGSQDKPVDLSGVEFRLLELLMLNRGRTLSRSELLSSAWNGAQVARNVVDVYICYLRTKIGDRAIATVRGHGYRFGSASPNPNFSALTSKVSP